MKALVNWASLLILNAVKCVKLRMSYLPAELAVDVIKHASQSIAFAGAFVQPYLSCSVFSFEVPLDLLSRSNLSGP
jgi:hypothetical protein